MALFAINTAILTLMTVCDVLHHQITQDIRPTIIDVLLTGIVMDVVGCLSLFVLSMKQDNSSKLDCDVPMSLYDNHQ
jgi:hypothetical protein